MLIFSCSYIDLFEYYVSVQIQYVTILCRTCTSSLPQMSQHQPGCRNRAETIIHLSNNVFPSAPHFIQLTVEFESTLRLSRVPHQIFPIQEPPLSSLSGLPLIFSVSNLCSYLRQEFSRCVIDSNAAPKEANFTKRAGQRSSLSLTKYS